jgi:ferredoxin
MRIVIDHAICESNGLCVAMAPDLFELDEDDLARVLDTRLDAHAELAARDAARRCPRQAIRLEP